MKKIITLYFIFFCGFLFSQSEIRLTRNISQGILGIELSTVLYQGETYEVSALANNYVATELRGNNVIIEKSPLDNFSYYVIPIDTGECSITIVGVTPEKNSKSILRTETFRVKEKPAPTAFIGEAPSGTLIDLNNLLITCAYNDNSAIYDYYKIDSWQIKIDEQVFTGKTGGFSKEVFQSIKECQPGNVLILTINVTNQKGAKQTIKSTFLR